MAQDGALAAVLLALFMFTPLTVGDCCRDLDAVGWLLALTNTLPVAVRRRYPLSSLAVIAVSYPTWVGLGYAINPIQSLPSLVAIYSLGASSHALAVRGLGLLSPLSAVFFSAVAAEEWIQLIDAFFFFVVLTAGWLVGVNVRERRLYAAELEKRTAELETAQAELARRAALRAASEERARIAREMHDVVAHTMSVITVQAGVGAHVAAEHPGKAAEALRTIETAGRQALEEMRRMLGVLRSDSRSDGDVAGRRAPQPGLEDLSRLVARTEEAGIPVTLKVTGTPARLPSGVDLSAFRVVQEALTNSVKHARGAAVHVAVSYGPAWIDIEVTDDGNGRVSPLSGHGAGLGLRGMAERVGVFDGEFEAGPRPQGGFRVRARFPVETP